MEEHRHAHAQHNCLKLVFTGYKGYKAVQFRDLDNQIQFITYIANQLPCKCPPP